MIETTHYILLWILRVEYLAAAVVFTLAAVLPAPAHSQAPGRRWSWWTLFLWAAFAKAIVFDLWQWYWLARVELIVIPLKIAATYEVIGLATAEMRSDKRVGAKIFLTLCGLGGLAIGAMNPRYGTADFGWVRNVTVAVDSGLGFMAVTGLSVQFLNRWEMTAEHRWHALWWALYLIGYGTATAIPTRLRGPLLIHNGIHRVWNVCCILAWLVPLIRVRYRATDRPTGQKSSLDPPGYRYAWRR
ncbi:MAG: hypothetical protein GY906_22370 [bacterium]|nr:hypothetical protein [bacterium]